MHIREYDTPTILLEQARLALAELASRLPLDLAQAQGDDLARIANTLSSLAHGQAMLDAAELTSELVEQVRRLADTHTEIVADLDELVRVTENAHWHTAA